MQYYAVNTSPSMSHYGILGMKWGIRRFENPDGTLTAAGKARYGTSENFRNSDYYKKYNAKKMAKEGKNPDGTDKSKEQLAIERKKKIARNVAIGAGIAAAAIAGGVLYKKWADENKDLVIKGGEALQRISDSNESDLYDEFYAAVGKHDIQRYSGYLPKHFAMREQQKAFGRLIDPSNPLYKEAKGINIKQLKAVDKMKIASLGSAKKLYNEMQKRGDFNGHEWETFETFNANLAGNHTDEKVKKFYQALKDKGYDGLIDINDIKNSGYEAKHPAIIINKGKVAIENIVTKNFADMDVEKLYQNEKVNAAKDVTRKEVKQLIYEMTPQAVISTAGISAAGGAAYKSLSDQEKKLLQKKSK